MRNVFPPQMSIGQIGIADIQIDVSSRDDIPVILLGLQHIYTTPSLRDAVFKILEEVAPTRLDNDVEKVVSINKGRPGMDQWSILVLGALRLGLNADYDRILELANQQSSSPREPPPQALTDPYMRFSPHTALHVPCKLPSLRKSLVPPISS